MPELRVIDGFDVAETKAIDTCTSCPKLCRYACPVAEAEARETSTPWNLSVSAGFLKRGRIMSDEIGDAPYHCSDCGACTSACLHSVDVPMVVHLARARLANARAQPEAVVELCGHFGTAGNPYGVSLEAALAEVRAAAAIDGAPRASGAILYLPGCATLREAPAAATAFLRALRVHGISGVATSEASASCCGLPLLWAGDLEGFRAQAKRHAARLANADVVVAHDSACAHTMRTRYAEVGVRLSPVVSHVVEFLEGRVSSISARAEGEHAFGDGCAGARRLGLGRAGRQLVERATGRSPLELPDLGGHPLDCCGASGLLPLTAPATAHAMAEARIEAFRASGAKRMVMFEPRCAAHLAKVAPSVEIVDGCQLLARV